MNSNYYQNPTFPSNIVPQMNNQIQTEMPKGGGLPAVERSYIENILRGNKGKIVKVYASFPDSATKDKEYTGIIEEAGLDHLILKDTNTGNYYMIKMLYINYFEFMEPIYYGRD